MPGGNGRVLVCASNGGYVIRLGRPGLFRVPVPTAQLICRDSESVVMRRDTSVRGFAKTELISFYTRRRRVVARTGERVGRLRVRSIDEQFATPTSPDGTLAFIATLSDGTQALVARRDGR